MIDAVIIVAGLGVPFPPDSVPLIHHQHHRLERLVRHFDLVLFLDWADLQKQRWMGGRGCGVV